MKSINRLMLFLVGLILLSSCGRMSSSRIQAKATDYLESSLSHTGTLEILAVSEPDSAFGPEYFSHDEMTGLLSVMQKVTDQIVEKTSVLADITEMDAATAALVHRQITATSEVQDLIFRNVPKGDWSGWKVRVDYQCTDAVSTYRCERWIFLDRSGKKVVKTLDIPLP